MERLLPLFPLQLVAFPGTAVPLHIFEERYRQMVGRAETAGTEFGIVLSKDGGVVNAGCTVVVETVTERYPDGRFDIIARGRRRFSLLSIDQEESWIRGEVEYFDDDDLTPSSADLRLQAMQAYVAVKAAQGKPPLEEPDPTDEFFSYQLARSVDDLDFQNMVLRSRSETARLEQFIEFVREYVPRTLYAAKMKELAPRNGSGHKPAEL